MTDPNQSGSPPPVPTNPEPGTRNPEPASVGSRIVRATVVVLVAGVLTKLLGLAKNVVIGAQFGTESGVTDCFLAAFSIVTAIYFVGEECLGPAFLPVYMDRRDRDGPAAAWRLASTIFNLQFLVLLPVVAAVAAFAPQIMEAATAWKLEDEVGKVAGQADRLRLAGDFLRWTAPALFGLSLASLTFMLLNARKKFFWASMGEGSLRALTIGAVVALGSRHWLGGWALVAGTVAGSVAKLATHLPGLWDELRHYRPRISLSGPDFGRFALLILPLIFGSVFAKFRDVFNNVYVMSAAGITGAISAMYFGRSIVETLNVLFPYSLSVGMFPYLCELAEKGDRRALGEVLDRSSRLMVFLFLPIAAALVVAAAPLADFMFTFKNLGRADAALIGLVTAASALSMPFYSVERVMMKGYFSSRRTLAPTIIGVVCSVLSMAACYLLVVRMGWTGERALLVVALAAVGARALKVLLLAGNLKRHLPIFALGSTAAFAAKALALTGLVWLAGRGAHALAARELPALAGLGGLKAKLVLMADLGMIGAASLAAFALAAWALRMDEWTLALAWARSRLAGLLGRLRARAQ